VQQRRRPGERRCRRRTGKNAQKMAWAATFSRRPRRSARRRPLPSLCAPSVFCGREDSPHPSPVYLASQRHGARQHLGVAR
jgi:hypothetical protein